MNNLQTDQDLLNCDNFQFILEAWIYPLIDDLYDKMDKDFIKECNVEKRDYRSYYPQMYSYYHNKRTLLKINYYGKDYKENPSVPHRMDVHKLSAIICRTMIEYKMIDFDVNSCYKYIEDNKIPKDNTQWLIDNALINFKIAFYASVVFLYQYMLFHYGESKEKNDILIHDKLIESKKLNLYFEKHNVNQHESFINCMILDIAKRDLGDRSFDYFMYSIIMYQLEEYNISLIKP